MNLSELIFSLNELKININKFKNIIDFENKLKYLLDKEKIICKDDFWLKTTEEKNKILKDIQKIKNIIQSIEEIIIDFDELQILVELLKSEENDETFNECVNKFYYLNTKIKFFTIEYLLDDQDNRNAILSINAGAGGIDSQDWVSILLRMYTRWCEKNKFNITFIESVTLDNIGFRNVTVLIKGKNAYGYLKGENGVHRLIRVSPFSSTNKRHTSFAAVEVIPEINNNFFAKIKNDELRIDTFRAGGAGGQSVNKTESAVRVTHIETGLTVSCQNERSQYQNKELAIKILSSKLFKLNEIKKNKQINFIRNQQKKNEWGNHIRSYVFMPYTLVKDHRTNFETGNINSILNGNIDDLLISYLKLQKS